MTTMEIFDETQCHLGEGPLWHPGRNLLFWFDILRFRLYAKGTGGLREWQFDEHVSAAGWINETRLLVASESALFVFDTETGTSDHVAPLEADDPATRSNDGRADPWGGFWIGTMGKAAEPGRGAIYRYYRGEVRKLFHDITISNSICFAPDGGHAYFTDTPTRRIMRQRLDEAEGWPSGDTEVFVDLNSEDLNPDGSVVDAEGTLWNAQWGASRVAAYKPDGRFLRAVTVGAAHTSCPAFGGPDLTTLYCTTARQGLSNEDLDRTPEHGMTFAAANVARGQAEHQVIL